ncbi:MAG TPA: DUF6290 family protein [Acidobacteriota bacterium]|nr:DUF6290 family protein [Acidobacteriota bacterium]
MKSVRLDETLEARLEEAARVSGQSVSAFIRQAIEERCEGILGRRLAPRLKDVAGVIKSQGGRARQSGKGFTQQVQSAAKGKRE